ncbi:MAG TPA: hypothetical protein VNT81_20130, partial [Vicinamibacterales bacterium]|nr:hypothetical protein [Vicinamibacterales bacterium]
AEWLEKKSIKGRTVTIKVRYDDFTTITRSQSTPDYTNDADAIAERAVKLLEKTEAGHRPIRLLGVSVHNFDRDARAAEGAEDADNRLPLEAD